MRELDGYRAVMRRIADAAEKRKSDGHVQDEENDLQSTRVTDNSSLNACTEENSRINRYAVYDNRQDACATDTSCMATCVANDSCSNIQCRRMYAHIREAEAEAEKTVRVEATVEGGVTRSMSFSEKTELYVRATGERTGLVYTEKLDADPRETVLQAYENGQLGETAEEMNTSDCRGALGTPCREYSAAELNAFAASLERELTKGCPRADRAEVRASQLISRIGVVNSRGADISGQAGRFDVTVRIPLKDDPMKSYEETVTGQRLEEIRAPYFLAQHREWEQTVLPETAAFEPGTYRTVLGSQAVNFILTTAWQLFSGKRVADGTSPLSGRLGQKVFADGITIRDYKENGYPFVIDAEGTLCRDVTLVENGVFVGCMQNLASAKLFRELRAGGAIQTEGDRTANDGAGDHRRTEDNVGQSDKIGAVSPGVIKGEAAGGAADCAATVDLMIHCTSTGNAGRRALLSGNIHTDMTIVPKNFVLEEGDQTLEELIRACGDGIYICESYDQFHSLNVVTGDFHFPCRGVRIRDGRLAECLYGLTMNGNVLTLFADVLALGKGRRIEPMAIYENYLVSGPAMLVRKLEISG